MKKNGLVWKFLEPQVVETSDHTNKTNKILPQSNIPPTMLGAASNHKHSLTRTRTG